MQNLSPRADWLYLMRLDDLWASLFRASLPPAPGLAASSCSYGRGFAFRFFRFRLAATPCGSATVAVIGSDWLLSSNKILPMLGTHRSRPPGRLERKGGTWTSRADVMSALRYYNPITILEVLLSWMMVLGRKGITGWKSHRTRTCTVLPGLLSGLHVVVTTRELG